MTKLHLGCGKKLIHGFINIDGDISCNPDVVMDISRVSERYENIDLILAVHVLEHFPRKPFSGNTTYLDTLKDWFKALKSGGILRLSVPDFAAICEHYTKFGNIEELYGLLLGGQRNHYDIHYHIFDFNTLERDLRLIGFKEVKTYDRWKTEHAYIDDYSAATLNPPFSRDGRLMSLNVEAVK
jgi:predicted SAM-dependent methyltransferase